MKKNNFRKANNYGVFNFALCVECRWYKMNRTTPIHGGCYLLEQAGIDGGVMAQAVCNKFLSGHGTDIDGNKVSPDIYSELKTDKLKDGSVYLYRKQGG